MWSNNIDGGPMKQETHVRRQLFVTLGLSEKEAFLYDLLLTHGEMAAVQIEKLSLLKKNTYAILKSLERRHLVQKVMREGKSFYVPGSPETLRGLVEDQAQAVKIAQQNLYRNMPNLLETYGMTVGKPSVRYLTGASGLRDVFTDIYSKNDVDEYGCVDFEAVNKVFPEKIVKELIPSRVENRVRAFALIADSPIGRAVHQRDSEELRVSIVMDKAKYPIPAEIEVYENKVAMMSFAKTGMVGIVIDNKDFATTIRSIFKKLFDLEQGHH
jgi:predicted transcriptional regulator